jgi:AraC-like DNA-binding protein
MLSRPPLTLHSDLKNNEKSSLAYPLLSSDMALITLEVNGADDSLLKGEIPSHVIQFYFCLKGKITFSFYGGRYKQELGEGRSFLFYNPELNLQQEISFLADSRMLCLFITVERLHELFVNDFSDLTFLEGENINKKFYAENPITPNLRLVLDQVAHVSTIPTNERLYYIGKAFELLSFYFDRSNESDLANCPFLLDESNVEKIRQAKKIVIENMIDPPGLKEISRMIGLNEYQLKVGFKNIYGSSVFQFLNDYKMEYARKLLDDRAHKVNEVSEEVGYSNPSHFIAAFKRKYGITPKKYVQALG